MGLFNSKYYGMTIFAFGGCLWNYLESPLCDEAKGKTPSKPNAGLCRAEAELSCVFLTVATSSALWGGERRCYSSPASQPTSPTYKLFLSYYRASQQSHSWTRTLFLVHKRKVNLLLNLSQKSHDISDRLFFPL